MCSLLVISDRNFDVHILAFTAEHLPTTSRATLHIASPMVVVAKLGSAVWTAFARDAPAFFTVALPGMPFTVTENISDGAAGGPEHFLAADITPCHQSTTFRQESSP